MFKPINECTTVYELLEDPNRWTQHEFARNKDGESCLTNSEEAVCFCLSGACKKIARKISRHSTFLMNDLGDALLRLHPDNFSGGNYVLWQDQPERTHAEVLAVVKEARI